MAKTAGQVFLVGAGPGDPGLLTLRAKECLEQADAVVYDNLIDPSLLDWCRDSCQKIYVGKRGKRHAKEQPAINSLLVRLARGGKRVVRLKGGDPFIFGRGGEEAEALADAKILFQVVPGVTSAVAAPAYAGIPLTHRLHSSMVSFVTGHEDPSKESNAVLWRKVPSQGTLVILMGVENLDQIVRELIHRAWDPKTPAAVIQWGTFPIQKIVSGSLQDIARLTTEAQLGSPAVIVVGKVVALREKLAWFEKRPLYGRTIVVTRARDQASGFSALLRSLGAKVLEIPAIQIVPFKTNPLLEAALRRLPEYDWVIFTSANTVDQLAKERILSGAWKGLRTCAIGPKTAERMKAFGIPVSKIAKEYRAEAIVPELGSVRGKKIFLPRAKVARDVLVEELKRRGASVDMIPVYETKLDPGARPLAKRLLKEKVDAVTFTSSSTVTHFLKLFSTAERRRLFRRAQAASIGPITTATLRKQGLKAPIQAKDYTTEGLAQALVQWFYGKMKKS